MACIDFSPTRPIPRDMGYLKRSVCWFGFHGHGLEKKVDKSINLVKLSLSSKEDLSRKKLQTKFNFVKRGHGKNYDRHQGLGKV
jgi:hypothetical protein